MKNLLTYHVSLYLSILIAFVLLSRNSYATHAQGADVTYKCLGGLQYEITVSFYRDCDGVNAPRDVTVDFNSASCGESFDVKLDRIPNTGQEITPVCSSTSTQCNGGSFPGVQEYVYRKVITLPSACNDWVFSFDLCCRNNAINTITNPGDDRIYIEAKLDNLNFPCNNSPTFSNKPISFPCVGQLWCFNHGGVDVDGDSLYYSLQTPQTSASGTVNFLPGYSPTQPMSSSPLVTFNPFNGDICMTPTIAEVGVLSVNVEEWRNGVLIGSVDRDIQIRSLACGNQIPVVDGINGTAQYSIIACAGSTITFDVPSDDLDVGQTTTLTWNNGIPGATFTSAGSPLATGTFSWTPTPAEISATPYCFTVSVTDDNCPLSGQQSLAFCITVTSNTLSASVIPDTTLCPGDPGATLTAIASNGVTPYNYLWSTTDTTPSIFAPAGTYTVLVGDATNCPPLPFVKTINQITGAITANAGPNQTVCDTTVAVQLNGSAVGGSGSVWQGGSNVFSPSNTDTNALYFPSAAEIAAGSTTLILFNVGTGVCASDTDTVIINYTNFQGVNTITATNASCFSGSSGISSISTAGGTPPYTYSWNTTPIQIGDSAFNIPNGFYSVNATDGNGCTTSDTFTIVQPPPLTASFTSSDVLCFFGNTGKATVTSFGGTAPYSYSWSAPSVSIDAFDTTLIAGSYIVTVTDSNNCDTPVTITINEPPILTTNVTNIVHVSCSGGNDGAATVTVGGGSPSYTFSWSPSGGNGATAVGLTIGNYTVTVTDSNGCTGLANVIINEPPPLSATKTQTNLACFEDSNGNAQVAVNGGTRGYSYSWSPSGGTDSLEMGITAGIHTVTITDTNGCQLVESFTITQPAPLILTPTFSNTTCALPNGVMNANASGGVPTYSYLWSTGDTTSNVFNAPAGSHTITVTDTNGCTVVDTIILPNATPPLSTSISSVTNVSCLNGSDGEATVSVTGGTTPFTYTWTPTGGNDSIGTALTAGNYTVIVIDTNGCTDTSTTIITEPPTPVSLTITSTNVSCNGGNDGEAIVIPAGGTPGYSFVWSNGDLDSIAGTLIAATYTATVTDSLGCTDTGSVVITQPPLLTASIAITNVSCNGGNDGEAIVTPAGGTAPYTYLWSNADADSIAGNLIAGTYSVTITDSIGCTFTDSVVITEPLPQTLSFAQSNVTCNGLNNGNAIVIPSGGTAPYTYLWSNLDADSIAGNLIAGTYSLTVTDALLCVITDSVTITEPAVLALTPSSTNTSCFSSNNGIASINTIGGTAPYSYLWSPSGGTDSTATGLTPGSYTVYVNDLNNCNDSATIVITEPALLTASIIQTNVNCNGDNTGQAIVTPAGGTAPYTYLWSNADTDSVAGGLIAGNYFVSVIDNNVCLAVIGVIITEPSLLVSSITASTNIDCNGNSNGQATVATGGGTAPYTYLWNDLGAQTTTSATGLIAGTYIVTTTDSLGCTDSDTAIITQPIAPLSAVMSSIDASCFNTNSGTAIVTPAGGTAPYTYLWSPTISLNDSLFNLSIGTYSVKVTDTLGCIAIDSITISQPTKIISSTSAVTSTCGVANGEAHAVVGGGFPPYIVSWYFGPTPSVDLVGVPSGSYTFVATDSVGCVDSTIVNVGNTTSPTAVIDTIIGVRCYGEINGSATVSATGGTGPLTYLWLITGTTDLTDSNLVAGNYVIQVTDSIGCQDLLNIVIPQPDTIITGVVSANISISCNGGNGGDAEVFVSGGTTPYFYSWLPSGDTTSLADSLAAGNNVVTVTDNNGCQIKDSITLTEPTVLTLAVTGTNINCFGNSNGTALATVGGGTPNYSYIWSPSGGSSANPTGLIAGTYTVIAQDAKGCSLTDSVTLTQPSLLTISTTSSNISCNGDNTGQAIVNPLGGTTPYTYLWSNLDADSIADGLIAGNYSIIVTDSNGCFSGAGVNILESSLLVSSINASTNVSCNAGSDGEATVSTGGGTAPYTYLWDDLGAQTTTTATGLVAGTYIVTTTDSLGCTDSDTIVITHPAAPLSTSIITVNNPCFGDNLGTATVTPAGGTAPYTYLWSITPSGNNIIAGLIADIYYVTVTDSLGCTDNDSTVVIDPPLLSLTSASTNVSCNGGSNGEAFVTPTGGTPDYSFAWSNGDLDSIADGLTIGTYAVTVTDSKGCRDTASRVITQPILLTAGITSTNVSCFGGNNGQAIATPAGGTAPYTYLWSNADADSVASGLVAGTYSVTVTDTNGCTYTDSVVITEPLPLNISFSVTNVSCNGFSDGEAIATVSGGTLNYTYLWSNADADSLAGGLTTGTYSLTVTDALLCVITDSIIITEPTILTSTVVTTDVSCFGDNTGTALATIGGGTLNYSYSWSNSQGNNSIIALTAGIYFLTVTDNNGCVINDTATINQPIAPISLSFSISNINCFGGSNGEAIVASVGGTTPYTYLWSNLDTDSIASGLVAGNYSVAVTDNKGCVKDSIIPITEPSILTTDIVNITNEFCELSNGSALSTATGGTAPYTFLWSNTDTTAALLNVSAGNYFITITDSLGCTQIDSVTITNISSPTITITSSTNVSCFGGNDGSASASPSLGLAPYSYLWTPSTVTTSNATGLLAGTNYIILTDVNGCTTKDSVIINEPPLLGIVVDSISTLKCFGGNDGSISVSATMGTPGYTYSWSTGATTPTVFNLASGSYTITATDTLGCTASQIVAVAQPAPVNVSSAIPKVTNETCVGKHDGTAIVTVIGGTAPFSYLWDDQLTQTTIMADSLAPGTYTIKTTDNNGCQDSTTMTIGSPAPVITTASIPKDTICYGDSIDISGSATGGTGVYSFFLNKGIGFTPLPKNVKPVASTTYILTALDQNNCLGSPDTVKVNVQSLFQSDVIINIISPICPGTSTPLSVSIANPSITGALTYSWNHSLGNTPGVFKVTPIGPTTYTVIVTNQCGVVITDSTSIVFKPLPTTSFTGSDSACGPLSVTFTDASTTPVDSITGWLWDFGDGTFSTLQNPIQTHEYSTPGTYNVTLTVTTDLGCVKDSIMGSSVTVYPNPTANFVATPMVTDIRMTKINFTNSSLDDDTLSWDFGNGDNTSPIINLTHTYQDTSYIYSDTGTYTIYMLVTNQYGCKNEHSLPIVINPFYELKVPNAFSPNPNGPGGGQYDIRALNNDMFYPFTDYVRDYHLMIFNRWGELIFESFDLDVGWDGYYNGELSQQDVYVWKIDLIYTDGQEISRVGDLTLLR